MTKLTMNWLTKQLIVKKRQLTMGEKILAESIFGQSLNLDHVDVVAHKLIIKNYAVSPNGNIYFHPKDWKADFSKESLEQQSWLIHELVHVWQIQQGIAVVRKALLNRRYQYVLTAGKAFLNYGIEQQAQMVQDYFLRSRKGQECESLKQCIPFLSLER